MYFILIIFDAGHGTLGLVYTKLVLYHRTAVPLYSFTNWPNNRIWCGRHSKNCSFQFTRCKLFLKLRGKVSGSFGDGPTCPGTSHFVACAYNRRVEIINFLSSSDLHQMAFPKEVYIFIFNHHAEVMTVGRSCF